MKRLFSLILTLSLCITSAIIPTYATDTTTIDHDLLSRGYPQSLISLMSTDAKQDIYENRNLTYSSSSYTFFNEGTGTYESLPIDGMLATYSDSPIPTDDLTILLIGSYDSSRNKVLVQLDYEWHTHPFFAYQDPISVYWNSSIFSLDINSFYKVDKYDAEIVDVNGVHHYTYGGIHSQSDTYVEKNSRGVMWFADIKSWAFTGVTALYGYAKFELNCTSSPVGKNIYYKYIHMQGANTGNISLGTDGIVSVDGGTHQSASNFSEIK